jgi:hypothetical protein
MAGFPSRYFDEVIDKFIGANLPLGLIAELGSMVLAAVVGRFVLKSRVIILLVSVLGAFGAMVANILVDGQGAFMYLIFTPAIYAVAVTGRYDLP